MTKGISEYTLKKYVVQAVESIVEVAERAESFEIVVSAKVGEIPTISYKINNYLLVPFYEIPKEGNFNG